MPPEVTTNSPRKSQEQRWACHDNWRNSRHSTFLMLKLSRFFWFFAYRVYFQAFVYVYIRVNSCFFLWAYVYVYFGVNSWVFFEALVFAYVILLSKYVTMSVYWTRHLLSKWNSFASRSLRQPSFERLRCWLHLLRPPLVMLNFVIFSTVL